MYYYRYYQSNMKITKLNFDENYDRIVELIEKSEFISFDCEMTGINNTLQPHKKEDNADERYVKMISVASKYSLIQIGLCCFCKDDNNKLRSYPYTFYIFPENSYGDVILSASSIDFLKKNNMDFQEWIMNGITYVTKGGEEYWKNKLGLQEKTDSNTENTEKTDSNNNGVVALSEQKDIQFFERNIDNLKKVLGDESATEYTFEFCNAFVRKYIYQYMEANYPHITLLKTSDNKLQALKLSLEEVETMKQNKLRKALGFRSIFKHLYNKVLVGHNCMYDILFIMRYLEGPLEESLTSFKHNFNSLFPCVFDTKYISSSGTFGTVYADTVLGELYNQLIAKNGNQQIVQLGDGISNDIQLHDAGYDALITGSLFWGLINENVVDNSNILNDAINKCGNIIFNMHSLYHVDLDPTRSNGKNKLSDSAFYLGNFTAKVLTNEINEVFKPIEYPLECIWINSESTFIVFKSSGSTVDIQTLKEKISLPEGWNLLTLEEFEAKKLTSNDSSANDIESPLKKQKV